MVSALACHMLGSLLLGVLGVGGILLLISVFEGEFRLFGQTIEADDTGTIGRLVAGFIGLALVAAATHLITANSTDLVTPAVFSLIFAGGLTLVAIVRGSGSLGFVTFDGEAVGSVARVFAGLMALVMLGAGYGFLQTSSKKDSPSAPSQLCPPGSTPGIEGCVLVAPSERRPTIEATATGGGFYVQLFSSDTESIAEETAQQEANDTKNEVCVYASRNVFGTAIGPLPESSAANLLGEIKDAGIPSVATSAFVARGHTYVRKRCFNPH